MSIVTKGGDRGATGLMYNRRVSKCHPRVEAYGAVDELNAALGLARATTKHGQRRRDIIVLQRDLVVVMGELATDPADLGRYENDGFKRVTPAMTARIEALIRGLEARFRPAKDWALPGGNLASAALDVARAACRYAERRVCALRERDQLVNDEVLVFLNRASDWLWLLARAAGQPGARKPGTSRRRSAVPKSAAAASRRRASRRQRHPR